MLIVGYNWESVNRHGVTAEMIDEVLAGTMISYFPLDDADDSCEMLVGYTLTERLLEIGLRYLTVDTVYFTLKLSHRTIERCFKRSGTMAKLNPDELNRAHKDLQAGARQRIADRGILQFRADPETVKAVMKAAEVKQMAVGALLRQWIQERLVLEGAQQKAPDLVQRVVLLEEAVNDLRTRQK